MRKLINKVVNKIIRVISNIFYTLKMLLHPGELPTVQQALYALQEFSMDSGNSCLYINENEAPERKFDVSIIVPAYNVEKSIDRCIESILKQKTNFSYEVIIVNDGSTDRTAQILEKYACYEHINVFYQENRGLSAARNKGINNAKGEYLCFVDSDDELSDGAIDVLVNVAYNNKAKLVAGSIDSCYADGSKKYTTLLQDKKANINELPGFAWGKIIHYSVFNNLRFPEGYWYEDSIMDQIVHPMCESNIFTVSHVCYKYYSNEQGITATSKGKSKSLDSLWITMKLLEERKHFGLSYDLCSYEHFLSMVFLTYKRTNKLGIYISKCIFVMQRDLMEQYYERYYDSLDYKKNIKHKILKNGNFRGYILLCLYWRVKKYIDHR